MEANPGPTEGSLNSRKKAERKARAQQNKADKKAAKAAKLAEDKKAREVSLPLAFVQKLRDIAG